MNQENAYPASTPKSFEVFRNPKANSLGHTEEPVKPDKDKKKRPGIIKKRYVRFRAEPSACSGTIGVLESGQTVHILDDEDPEYYKIRVGSSTVGYVRKDCCEEVC